MPARHPSLIKQSTNGSSAIGVSPPRADAVDKVTGRSLYPGDLVRPDMLHMKTVFAGRPHARLLRLDTALALAAPGVVAVFTAADVPVNEYGLITYDQPVIVGPGSAKAGSDVARCEGDTVALVVAESEEQAAAAARLLQMDWEDLPVVTDPRMAMLPGAPLLSDTLDTNILQHNRLRQGNVAAAWAECAVVVSSTYHTPWQEHAYLAPEAGLAYMDDAGRVMVEVAGQWTHEDQMQVAHALGLPVDQVRIRYASVGGAFGGREDMTVQVVLALAAWRLAQRGIQRAVKIIWSREESIVGHHKRHPYFMRAKFGADASGRVLAAECELVADAGAYTYTSTKVLNNATLMCIGPYDIPNVSVDAYAVLTNNVPSGAFRGFGGPQGSFLVESQMNKLAHQLGMDPVELRRRNLIGEGAIGAFGTAFPAGVTIRQVVDQCAQQAGWGGQLPAAGAAHLKRGRGIACALKNIGFSFGAPEECVATIELHGTAQIERAVLRHAAAECGQGAHAVLLQMAASALGLPLQKVAGDFSDTASSGNSGSASASRLTFMSGNSIRGAAELALQKWRDEERPALATFRYVPRPTTMLDAQTGQCDPNISYGYVAEIVDVEVDVETGHVHVLNVVCADDVGRAINPQQVEGQIEGGIVQAHGYAVLENFISDGGSIKTKHLSTYLIPTVLDVPDRVQSVILEYADPQGPWGARGMAEMPYLPYAPAVTAAVHAAIGVWIDEFPLTPARVLAALHAAG